MSDDQLAKEIRGIMPFASLARSLGVKRQAVSQWLQRPKGIPAERVLDIEKFTGISRHRLRPDIYPDTSRSRRRADHAAL